MTRQNLVPSSDCKLQVNALIPLWDLCNHAVGKVSHVIFISCLNIFVFNTQFSTDFSTEKDSIVCYAVHNFSKGSEVSPQFYDTPVISLIPFHA